MLRSKPFNSSLTKVHFTPWAGLIGHRHWHRDNFESLFEFLGEYLEGRVRRYTLYSSDYSNYEARMWRDTLEPLASTPAVQMLEELKDYLESFDWSALFRRIQSPVKPFFARARLKLSELPGAVLSPRIDFFEKNAYPLLLIGKPPTSVGCDLKGSDENTSNGLCNTQMPLPKRVKE